MSYQDNSHALCLGLWLLSKQDGADDFQQWQDENRLPTTYTDGQVQQALYIFPDDYDGIELKEYAEGYVESQRQKKEYERLELWEAQMLRMHQRRIDMNDDTELVGVTTGAKLTQRMHPKSVEKLVSELIRGYPMEPPGHR